MKSVSPLQRRRGFNIHAFVFVVTTALLLAINLSKGAP